MKSEDASSKKPDEKTKNRRSKGVYVRLSEAEKKKLKELSQQSGVSVSQLLRSGALDNLYRLPRFRKLPAEVTAALSKLDRLTTALVYLSQRAESDALFAQDIRAMVYDAGDVISQVKQFCSDNITSFGTITQLDRILQVARRPHETAQVLPTVVDQLQTLRTSFQSDQHL